VWKIPNLPGGIVFLQISSRGWEETSQYFQHMEIRITLRLLLYVGGGNGNDGSRINYRKFIHIGVQKGSSIQFIGSRINFRINFRNLLCVGGSSPALDDLIFFVETTN